MTVGPFDLRKRRLRCVQCSSSHLKCSGKIPCDNCTRRGKNCTPPPQDTAIKVRRGQREKENSAAQLPTPCPLIRPLAIDKQSLYVIEFFDKFLDRNSFTGRPGSSCSIIHSILEDNTSLSNVISAIGALQTSRMRSAGSVQCTRDALVSYRNAVTALQSEIECVWRRDIVGLSWSTLFLGLFELMYDTTGDGWIRHMLYGTSRLLQLLSPEGCSHGARRVFYLEVRIFEIARSMLFSQESFLTMPPWRSLTQMVWLGSYARDWTPFEALLDLATLVADLCIRTTSFIRSKETHSISAADCDQLHNFAMQGTMLKTELTTWSHMAREWYGTDSAAGHRYLSAVYYSAISIYHSGIYDYSSIWSQAGVVTPSLDPSEVQQHVRTILDVTMLAMRHTNLSGVVFLVPLRIAGARARSLEQRAPISRMLFDITIPFRAAKAVMSDLEEVWATSMNDNS